MRKLSEIKGQELFELLAHIITPICNIARDEEAAALFKQEKLPEGVTVKEFILARFEKSVPPLLIEHGGDFATILAAINGVPTEEYMESLDFNRLAMDTLSLLTDNAVAGLFTSAQTEKPSGSAPESTGGRKRWRLLSSMRRRK